MKAPRTIAILSLLAAVKVKTIMNEHFQRISCLFLVPLRLMFQSRGLYCHV